MRWSRRVRKLLNRNCDSTPDRSTSVIALCFKVVGTPVGLRFGGVSVAFDLNSATRQMSISRITPNTVADLRFELLDGQKARLR